MSVKSFVAEDKKRTSRVRMRANFTLKMSRPGADPAAEPPHSTATCPALRWLQMVPDITSVAATVAPLSCFGTCAVAAQLSVWTVSRTQTRVPFTGAGRGPESGCQRSPDLVARAVKFPCL